MPKFVRNNTQFMQNLKVSNAGKLDYIHVMPRGSVEVASDTVLLDPPEGVLMVEGPPKAPKTNTTPVNFYNSGQLPGTPVEQVISPPETTV
jgi:hypothetical protein